MAHHLIPGIELDWIDRLVNCFLIREPAAMLASLAKVIERPALEQTGLPQQVSLFERLRGAGGPVPPVVDSRDVLRDPRAMLSRLCKRVGVRFDEAMLTWPPGPRQTDGIWARHWYAEVEKSSGFAPERPRPTVVPEHLQLLLAECQPLYDHLFAHRLLPFVA